MAKNTSIWTLEKRKELQMLLRDGYSLNQIKEIIGKSIPAISKEVKRGVTEEEYKQQRYIKYNIAKAIYEELSSLCGEEQLEYLFEMRSE